jgi:hypothetical protein
MPLPAWQRERRQAGAFRLPGRTPLADARSQSMPVTHALGTTRRARSAVAPRGPARRVVTEKRGATRSGLPAGLDPTGR